MNKDLSKDRRFVTDLPKAFSVGDMNLGQDTVDQDPKEFAQKDKSYENKIQKALFVVNDLRTRTVNTLDALKTLNQEDSLRIRVIEQKLNELKDKADVILDPSSSGDEREATEFLGVLGDVKKLLKEYKNTEVQGQTFEEFLRKTDQESHRRLLLEKEISKVLSDASKNLGAPFSSFLKENIRQISSTPIERDASNIAFTALGPIAPVLAAVRDLVPEVMDSYDKIKSGLGLIKDKFFSQDKKDPIAAEVIAENIDVDKDAKKIKATNIEKDLASLRKMSETLKGMSKKLDQLNENNENFNAEEKEHEGEVLQELKLIRENSEEEVKKKEGKGLGGMLGNVASLGKWLLGGKLISTLGSGLGKLLGNIAPKIGEVIAKTFSKLGPTMTELGATLARGFGVVLANPATWAAAAVAIAGAIANYIGSDWGRQEREKENKAAEGADKIIHPEGFRLSPDKEEKLGIKSSPPAEKDLPRLDPWMRSTPPELDVKPKAIPQSSVIRPNKIEPRVQKEIDWKEMAAVLSESIQKSIQGTSSGVLKPVDKRKSDYLPMIAKDAGLLLINQGIL